MVHLCCDLTAVSSSGRLRRSDVSADNRDGCVDMRQLQCQTWGRGTTPKRRRDVCEEERTPCTPTPSVVVHFVHPHWFSLNLSGFTVN